MRSLGVWALVAAVAAALLAVPASALERDEASTTGAGEVAIFYYPWFSNPKVDGYWAHWFREEPGATPKLASRYYPARGLYSSSETAVTKTQIGELAATGVDTVIVSWWGYGSVEDRRLPRIMTQARRYGLSVAIHQEPYPGRTPESTVSDINGLRANGITDFYVYDAERDLASDWAVALSGLDGVRVFAHTNLVGWAKKAGFDGFYTYDVRTWGGATFKRICTQARSVGILCAPSVGPGYDARLATDDPVVRERNDGKTYDAMWRAAVGAKADIVTLTSYNEWQEGTQIEPARARLGHPGYDGDWGKTGAGAERAYLDRTALWSARYHAAAGT
jgi:glycoprotein endo-alpha-1,2-mannosidase